MSQNRRETLCQNSSSLSFKSPFYNFDRKLLFCKHILIKNSLVYLTQNMVGNQNDSMNEYIGNFFFLIKHCFQCVYE